MAEKVATDYGRESSNQLWQRKKQPIMAEKVATNYGRERGNQLWQRI
jgi:hypothetical protein